MFKEDYPFNSIAPFNVQTRAFHRRILNYAYTETGGDIVWAAATLGLTEEVFLELAQRLGGVLPGMDIIEPFWTSFDSESDSEIDNEDNEIEEKESEETTEESKEEDWDDDKFPSVFTCRKCNTISAPHHSCDCGANSKVHINEDVWDPFIQKEETESSFEPLTNLETSEEFVETEIKTEEIASETEVVPTKREPLIVEVPTLINLVETNKNGNGRGRPPVSSPDPNFMTRKDVEGFLNLSTSGVMRLKAKGDLEAILDEKLGVWLFNKEKVEEYAKKKDDKRKTLLETT